MAKKPTAVDAEVRAILGFTEEQFRRIVVLPQGKFETSSRRPRKIKNLSKTLFGTSIYETITDELQRDARTRSQLCSQRDPSQGISMSG